MSQKKQLWILAGGNGSGKTTFYEMYLKPLGIKFVNADLIAKKIDSDSPEDISYKAATVAEKMRTDLLEQGVPFCFETVFSHKSKIDFLAKAKGNDYKIVLVYIHLIDSSLNEARVHQRKTEGGHGVPLEKIHSRIPRTMKHIETALMIVDEAWILDNSSESNRFKQVATMESGKYTFIEKPIPEWVKEIVPIDI
ncbi:MAG: AAA family ATPase [Desulfobacteraceae bacterium]|nr:AAA family ATPase [Desulfobacteraceae bacterium]